MYDGMGNRIRKFVDKTSGDDETTWYIRDARGNDYMSSHVNIDGTEVSGGEFYNIHYVNLLDFALKNVKPGHTRVFNNFSTTKLKLDDTNGGKTPSSPDELRGLNSRIVK